MNRKVAWYIAAPFLLVVFWLAGTWVAKCVTAPERHGFCWFVR